MTSTTSKPKKGLSLRLILILLSLVGLNLLVSLQIAQWDQLRALFDLERTQSQNGAAPKHSCHDVQIIYFFHHSYTYNKHPLLNNQIQKKLVSVV